MQLSDQPKVRSIRAKLSVATYGLLLGATANGVEAADESWRVDTGAMYYTENDRIDVQSVIVDVRRRFGEENFVTVNGAYDAVSGASPTGASPIHVSTGASGSAPMASFSETRKAVGGLWDAPVTDLTKMSLGINHSRSHTYESSAGSVVLSSEFNQRNTTMTFGVGYSRDLNKPAAGVPAGLSDVGSGNVIASVGVKRQVDLQLGVTQALARGTLAYLNYVWSNADGYLSNPYKVVSVVHSLTGESLGYQPIHEKRPDNRRTNALLGQLNHQFGTGVGYATYRFFWDNWDVWAHNLELKYRQPLNEHLYMQTLVRGYIQGAAGFYRPVVANNQIPEYVSADYRLTDLQTVSAGLKVGYRTGEWGEFTFRYEYVRQMGEEHPAGAFGAQRTADFFPDLMAHVIHVGYSVDF